MGKKILAFVLMGIIMLTGAGLEKMPVLADPTSPDSIYFTSAEMDEFRLLKTSPSHSSVWNNLSTWADAHIGDSPIAQLPQGDKVAWLGAGHTVRHYIETMGFMYAMTDNTAYADAALGWMESVAAWTTWGDPSSVQFNEAEFLRGYSFGYSVFYDYMTAGQKATILDALASHTTGVYNQMLSMNPPGNGYPNHWGTLAACVGLSALAIGPDHADSATWLNAATTYTQLLISWGGEDGGWFEGPGYTMSLFSHVIPFLDALKRNGTDLFSGSSFLANHAYYYIYLSNTLNLETQGRFESLMGVEDYEEKLGYNIDVPGVNTLDFMYLLSSEYNNGYFQQFADLHSAQDEIQSYIWRSPTLTSLPLSGLPETRRFDGIGYVVMKGGWGDNDLNIVFKSGRSMGHALSSQNEFTIYYNGKKLTGAPGYVNTSIENDTFAHNSLLVNGLGQYWEPQGGGDVGYIEQVDANTNYTYARGDASAVYPGGSFGQLTEWLRHFVLVDDAGFIVIYDDITAPASSQFEWLLNEKRLPNTTGWQPGLEPSSLAIADETVTITKTGAKLEAQILEPASFLYDIDHFSYNPGWYYHDYDYIKVRPAVNNTETEFLTVLFPMAATGSSLPTEKISSGNVIGAKVTDGETVYLTLFSADGNPVNEYVELGASYQSADGNSYTFDGTRVLASFTTYQVLALEPSSGSNQAPVLNAVGGKSVSEGSLLQFTVSATDPDNDTLTYSADLSSLPSGASFNTSTATFSWTPADGDGGTYTGVRFTVSDGNLTDYEDISITVNDVASGSSAVSVSGPDEVNPGDQFSVQILVNPGTAIAGIQFNLAFDSSQVTVDTIAEGNLFTQDGASSYFNSGTINNSAGTITGVSGAITTPGQTISTQGTFATITMTAAAQGEGSALTLSGVIVGDVNGQPLSSDLTNGQVNINQAPVLNAIGSKTVIEGELLSFTISATDPGDDTLTYSVTGLPEGAAFDSATALFSWTPRYNQAGSYAVTFSTSDGLLSDTEDVTFTITQACENWDVNGDGFANVLDLVLIGQHWEETGLCGWLLADTNEDGAINVLDMIVVGQNWTG